MAVTDLELFDLAERHVGEGKGRCPKHLTGEHEDRNPSCAVNFTKGTWYCYVCKEGGKISEMLDKMNGEETPAPQEEAPHHVENLTDEIVYNDHREWLASRGLDPDNSFVRYFSVRSNDDDDWLVIWPVEGVVQQRWMGAKEPPNGRRYDTKGRHGASVLFWATLKPERGDLVWLTEGPLDAVAMAEAGATASVASMGAGLSDQQAYELRDYFVLVAYDRDAPGVVGAEKAVKQLSKFGGVCASLELPVGGKDPGELWQNDSARLVSFVRRQELEYQPDEQRYVESWRDLSPFSPVSTGISGLDRVLGGGWYPGVHVVKGPPKSYKSTVVLAMARAAARQQRGVLYLSTELSRREIWARISAGIEGAPAWNVLELNPQALPPSCYEEQRELAKHLQTFENVPLRRLLQVADMSRPSLVIVDYLQGLSGISGDDSSNLMARVKEASALLTGWARDNDTPVVVVSSTSNEGTTAKYSGDVEYDAASVSSLTQSGYAAGLATRHWKVERIRRGVPEGVDTTVTIDLEAL